VEDTRLFTGFSIGGELTPDTLSERRGCVLRASVRILMVEYLPRATVVLKGLFAGNLLVHSAKLLSSFGTGGAY